MTPKARFSPYLAVWSLVGLGAALVLGIIGQTTGAPGLNALAGWVTPLGRVWLGALQMTVIPLVVTQILAATVRTEGTTSVGGLGGRVLALFIGLNVAAGILVMLVTPPLLGLLTLPPDVGAILHVETIPDAAVAAVGAQATGFGEWLVGLIPRNPFAAAAQGNILHLLVFTVLIGFAISRLPPKQRRPLAEIFRSLADAMLILVGWVLWGAPVGVFALVFGLTLETGLGAVGLITSYLALVCGLLLLVIGLHYPLTVLFGRTSLRRFARALAPAQIVAVSTQSSLASLPAMIEGGKEHLDLPPESTGFVLPLLISSFKMCTVVLPTASCLFLAHVFGVQVGTGDMVTFMFGVLLVSFSAVGVPRGGSAFRDLPFFLAVGIPIEGVVIIEAVKTIPDVFLTLLNVTSGMSAATLLSRGSRAGGD